VDRPRHNNSNVFAAKSGVTALIWCRLLLSTLLVQARQSVGCVSLCADNNFWTVASELYRWTCPIWSNMCNYDVRSTQLHQTLSGHAQSSVMTYFVLIGYRHCSEQGRLVLQFSAVQFTSCEQGFRTYFMGVSHFRHFVRSSRATSLQRVIIWRGRCHAMDATRRVINLVSKQRGGSGHTRGTRGARR